LNLQSKAAAKISRVTVCFGYLSVQYLLDICQ